jgi:hypothetical protein
MDVLFPGKKFGHLIFLKDLGPKKATIRSKRRATMWLCRCGCGTVKEFKRNNVQRGTQSCGCLRIKNKWFFDVTLLEISAIRNVLANYKNNAKRRNLSYELTFKQFYELTQRPCYYCGAIRTNKSAVQYQAKNKINKPFHYNGIDRLDNNEGYTSDNCVSACYSCNHAKHQKDQKEFLDWIKRIYEYLNLKEYSPIILAELPADIRETLLSL